MFDVEDKESSELFSEEPQVSRQFPARGSSPLQGLGSWVYGARGSVVFSGDADRPIGLSIGRDRSPDDAELGEAQRCVANRRNLRRRPYVVRAEPRSETGHPLADAIRDRDELAARRPALAERR